MKKKLVITGIVALFILSSIILFLLISKRGANIPNRSAIITPIPTMSSTFVVVSPGKSTPDRSDPPVVEWNQALEEYRINEPDFFLMNFAMHNDKTFKMRYIFKKIPRGHFSFIVTLTGTDKNRAKEDVITWIKSTGLTDTQIQALDIEYQ